MFVLEMVRVLLRMIYGLTKSDSVTAAPLHETVLIPSYGNPPRQFVFYSRIISTVLHKISRTSVHTSLALEILYLHVVLYDFH